MVDISPLVCGDMMEEANVPLVGMFCAEVSVRSVFGSRVERVQ